MKRLFLLVLAVFVLSPFVAADVERVLDEVLEMLDKDVDPAIVLSWLEQQTRPVAKLSSDDVTAIGHAVDEWVDAANANDPDRICRLTHSPVPESGLSLFQMFR